MRSWGRGLSVSLAAAVTAGIFVGAPPATAVEVAATGEPTTSGVVTEVSEPQVDGGPQPTGAAAMDAAKRLGVPVEDLSQRTATTQVFAQPDGTWQARIASEPVRVRRSDGSWVDIDTTLVQNAAGEWVPRAAAADVVFSDGGSGPFVTMGAAGEASFALDWPTPLPAPVVAGSTLTYRNAVPHGDLVVQALPGGFSHDIVLHQAPSGPVDYRIPLQLDGLTVVKEASGALSVRTTEGKEAASAPAPVMWDHDTTTAGDPQEVTPLATTVDGTGVDAQLVLTPDVRVLQDPTTQYPVTLDPTFTRNPFRDTWVQTPDFTSSQVGSTELRAGTYDVGGHKARSFVDFNTDILEGKQILDATLKLRNFDAANCVGSPIRVNAINESWDKTTLTWPGPDIYTGTYDEFSTSFGATNCPAAGWASWDVKPIVEKWAKLPTENGYWVNNGFRIRAVDETVNASWRRYRSANFSDTTVRPDLVVTYNTKPVIDTSSISITPCLNTCSPAVTDTTTPTLSFKATDPDAGEVLTYKYEIRQSGTTTPVAASGDIANVTPGTVASWTVPGAQALQDLTDYEFRVGAHDGDTTTWTVPDSQPWQPFRVDVDQPPTTLTDLTVSPCVGTCTTAVTDTSTPTLSAKSTDSDSATLTYVFKVRKTGTSQALTSPSITANQNTLASWTVPAGALPDQGNYEFQATASDAKTPVSSAWTPFSIDLDETPSVPTGITITPCVTPCTSTVTDSATPTISASSSDADSPTLTYQFQIRNQATGTDAASGTTRPVAQGKTASWLVPVGKLTDGGQYEVRVTASDQKTTTTWSTWTPFSVDIPQPNPTTVPATERDKPITSDVVWGPAGSPYVVTGAYELGTGGTLTMLPGTVVKFGDGPFGRGSILVNGGKIIADGSANRPIIWTSLKDDTVLGDTNGDGNATTPAPGDSFSSVDIYPPRNSPAPTSVLDNVAVRYSGMASNTFPCGNPPEAGVVVRDGARVVVTHSEFVNNQGAGVSILPGAFATVSNSRFASNRCGVRVETTGDVVNNVFEASNEASITVWYGGQINFEGNWFYSQLWFYDSTTRATASFRGNAILGASGGRGSPDELRHNWWGRPLEPPASDCHDPNANYYPPVDATKVDLSCPSWHRIVGYYEDILPALDTAPAFPDAGLESSPAVQPAVPQAQTLGDASSGSEFAYRPTGLQADPVNSATGSYIDQVTDASVASLGVPLTATRTYNSADTSSGSLGKGWSFGYDLRLTFASTDQVEFVAGDGQQVAFTKNADGTWAGDAGVTAGLVQNADGTYTLTTRAQARYTFDGAGKALSVLDRNNQGVTFSYDATTGKLASATSAGRSLTFTYVNGLLQRVTMPNDTYVEYGYTSGLLTSVRDLDGKTTTYGYDTAGRLTSETNPLLKTVMRLAYHPTTGRVSDQWDALNKHTTFAWDPVEERATMIDPRGGQWVDDYTGNVLMSRTDPLGRKTTYEYDGGMQLIAVTNPRGIRSMFTYNEAGDMVASTGPHRMVTTQYNTNHDPISTVNAKGTETRFGYDTAGNLKTVITIPANPADSPSLTEGYTINAQGLVEAATNTGGKTTTYTYTTKGDLKTVTTPQGRTTSYTYGPVGRLATSIDPRGNVVGADPTRFTTKYAYTGTGQIDTVTNPLGHVVDNNYDDAGRLDTVTDPKNRITDYGYDDAGHVTSVQGPDPQIPAATATYDPNGNLKTSTDPSGRTITYDYDLANQVTTVTGPLNTDTDPAKRTYTFGYDKSGNLTSIKKPNPVDPTTTVTTTLSYNASNLLTGIDYPDTTPDVTYTYDIHGNRTKMTDGAGTVSYTYDTLDRLRTVTRGTNTNNRFTYEYNALGLIKTTTNPLGRSFGYDYHDDGQLKTVTDTTSNTLLASYTYTPAGAPETGTLADGSKWTRAYDNAGRLARLTDVAATGSVLLDDTYTFDAAGNPEQIRHADNTTDTYTYDPLDRLTAVCYNTTTCTGATDYIRWGYDAVGNRTSETRPAGTTTYDHNPTTGLLSSMTKPGGAVTTYTHDPLGRMTKATSPTDTTTYSYNLADRLTSQTTGGVTTNYTYDGDGRRLTATSGSTTTNFWWEPRNYQLIGETDTTGAVIRSYAYGLGRIATTNPAGVHSYLHTDAQGSVRTITDPTGAVDWRRTYEPYGILRNSQHVDPTAAANPIGFAGEYTDTTGESHLRARQYDPTLGAFTTPDPAGATNWSGTTTYANANPMAFADPYGLWSIGDAIHGAAEVVNAVGPTVATVASVGAMASTVLFPPAAPVLGVIAAGATGLTAAASAYLAYDTCTNGPKGACAGAVLSAAVNTATAAAGGAFGAAAVRLGASRVLSRLGTRLSARVGKSTAAKPGTTLARTCLRSFAATTLVLMADGTKKPIEDIKVGDKVVATDPETGERVIRKVTRIWVHDDQVLDLVVDGEVITTTEDHLFWSVTDQTFERADQLVPGEVVLGDGGRQLTVSGLRVETERTALAYNLSIAGVHTYHVGESEVVVHNDCDPFDAARALRGSDPEDVLDVIPDNWIVSDAPKAVGGGMKFSNPSNRSQIMIFERGSGLASDGVHGGPYLRLSSGRGAVERIPLLGNPILGGP